MPKRKVIKIDVEKCDGCGLCIPNCPEGAIQIIDKKARLVSDLFCDGLGACLGHCPQGAITIEEREAQDYSERRVMENIIKQGKNVIGAHLEHLKEHNQEKYLKEAMDILRERKIEVSLEKKEAGFGHRHGSSACPGSKMMDLRGKAGSQLKTWPIQINLIPPHAPYLNNAALLIAADCVAFAYADFHRDLLKDKILLVGCPKLDDTKGYQEKINRILKENNIKSVTYAHMEVPCCFGFVGIIREAISQSAKDIPFTEVVIGIKGEKIKC